MDAVLNISRPIKIRCLPGYNNWLNMHLRCYYPKHNRFYRYGARGITVCERWRDFKTFMADMGLPPSPKHSVDRRDNDGNYEPLNCKWATAKEQAANRSTSKRHKKEQFPNDLHHSVVGCMAGAV